MLRIAIRLRRFVSCSPSKISVAHATTGPELSKDQPPVPSDPEYAGCFGWQGSRVAPARCRQSAYRAYLLVVLLSVARQPIMLPRRRLHCRNPALGCPDPLPTAARKRFPVPVAAGPWAAGPGRDEPRTA